MSTGKNMFVFKNNRGSELLPNALQDAGLYSGRKFVNDQAACSVLLRKAGQATQFYPQGKLTVDFAKAYCKARLAMGGQANAFGVNDELFAVAEYVDDDNYTGEKSSAGETICLVFNYANGKFFANKGGGAISISKTGYAPFFFALWGWFWKKEPEFGRIFVDSTKLGFDTDAEELQKSVCALAGTAYDLLSAEPIIDCPTTVNVSVLNAVQMASARYAPSMTIGTFTKFSVVGQSGGKIPKFRSVKKFCGYYARADRELSDQEKQLIPSLDGYILPEEVVTACALVANTRDTIRPMTNILLRGDPSVGKTAGARAMAAGLGLPYTSITCNAGTELYDLIGQMMPNETSDASVNDIMEGLPTATDISMDPVSSYEQITGRKSDTATETDCMAALVQETARRYAKASENGFHYVESELVKAIRNGWLCEIQEPSLITRPAVMPGLNGLMDETGCITLPTGERLKRHPDAILVTTLNVDLEGCRPLNQAFLDRHHIVIDMKKPSDSVMVKRLVAMTACAKDEVRMEDMLRCAKQIADVCAKNGVSDGNTNSMRALANWVTAVRLIGDYVSTAEYTVVSGATADIEVRKQLSTIVANIFG